MVVVVVSSSGGGARVGVDDGEAEVTIIMILVVTNSCTLSTIRTFLKI